MTHYYDHDPDDDRPDCDHCNDSGCDYCEPPDNNGDTIDTSEMGGES